VWDLNESQLKRNSNAFGDLARVRAQRSLLARVRPRSPFFWLMFSQAYYGMEVAGCSSTKKKELHAAAIQLLGPKVEVYACVRAHITQKLAAAALPPVAPLPWGRTGEHARHAMRETPM
jgi:hypothetical protein